MFGCQIYLMMVFTAFCINAFQLSVLTASHLTKADMRKEVRNKINLLSTKQRQIQSKKIQEKLYELPVFRKSKRISVYLSTDTEVSTVEIVKRILEEGKTCFVPRYRRSYMEMVKLESMEDWRNLPLNKDEVKQPRFSEQRENALETGGLDLIIVPGVAFTTSGDRLGYGRGCYDTFFNNLFKVQTRHPATVALAFKEQIVSHIPTESHDVKMDNVLYPEK